MAESVWPDGTPRSVTNLEYEVNGYAWSNRGVLGPAGTSLVFGDSTGMQVKIRANRYAVINGSFWASGSTIVTQSIASNGTSNPRIDLVVLRLNRSTWLIEKAVKQGTPAVTPVPPALELVDYGAGSDNWELPIATVRVDPGVSTITAANVVDVATYLGSRGEIQVATVAALDFVRGVPSGQTARVGLQNYLYVEGDGWRRADWTSAWGVIGGKEWAGTGNVFAVGIIGNELPVNMDSGPVTTLAGRRYRISWHATVTVSAAAVTVVMFLRDTNTSGAVRGSYVSPPIRNGFGYDVVFSGEFEEGTTSTRTYICSAYASGGSVSIGRTTATNNKAYLRIEDIGPAGKLTSLG